MATPKHYHVGPICTFADRADAERLRDQMLAGARAVSGTAVPPLHVHTCTCKDGREILAERARDQG